jgi:hypothetical protein
MDHIGWLALGLLVALLFLSLIYILLFKAAETSRPLVSRGAGLLLLAGVLKVFLYLLSETVSPAFGSQWVNYALAAIVVSGVLLLLAGLGGDSRF